uniref:Uncharacterized protein n=1 Tax=Meloidogyne hapla TaxID=6305 RepID=A0A1I8AZV3_MELHA
MVTAMMMVIVMMLFCFSMTGPFELYISPDPCPNCEKWCANDPRFKCNYSCEWFDMNKRIADYTPGFMLYKYGREKWVEIVESGSPEKGKLINETCTNDKDVNCTYRNIYYPLCDQEFKAYDKGMESNSDCHPGFPKNYTEMRIYLTTYYVEQYFKFWAYVPHHYSEKDNFINWCGMQCSNGKLVRKHSLPLPPLITTPKSTPLASTKTSTTKLTTPLTTSLATTKTSTTKLTTPTPKITTSKVSTKKFPIFTKENKLTTKAQTLTTHPSKITTKDYKNEAISQGKKKFHSTILLHRNYFNRVK